MPITPESNNAHAHSENLTTEPLNFGIESDLSPMRASDIADYHLAVGVMQRGAQQNIFIPDQVIGRCRKNASEFHYKLLLSISDACLKELIPWDGGKTTFEDWGVDLELVQPTIDNLRLHEKYVRPDDEEQWDKNCAILNVKSRVYGTHDLFSPSIHRISFGMRQIMNEIDDQSIKLRIIKDALEFAIATFRALDTGRKEHGIEVRDNGWLQAATFGAELCDLSSVFPEHDSRVIVKANQLLGASHGAVDSSILERFTISPNKARGMKEALEATRKTSYESIFNLASSFGRSLMRYL